jgi:hypothetical protein
VDFAAFSVLPSPWVNPEDRRDVSGEGNVRRWWFLIYRDRQITAAKNRKERKKCRILHIEKGVRSQTN